MSKYPLIPDIFWKADDSAQGLPSESTSGEKQNHHTFTALECGLFMFQATTVVLITCPIHLPSLTPVPLLCVYKCFILLSSIRLLALSCQY